MENDETAGHCVGILLVLAMLSCAAAFEAPAAREPERAAFERNAACAAPDACDADSSSEIPFTPLGP